MGENVFAPPSVTSEAVSPSLRESGNRFVSAFVAWGLILATLNGGASTVLAAQPLAKVGGFEYVPWVTSLSIVRERGPVAAVTATWFALIVWSNPLGPTSLRTRLFGMSQRVVLTSLLGFPLIVMVAVAAAAVAARTLYGVPWGNSWALTVATIQEPDLFAGAATFAVGAVVVALLSSFGLAPLARTGWSLSAKVFTGWIALFVIRTAISKVLALLQVAGAT
jgi:hypothetical protein